MFWLVTLRNKLVLFYKAFTTNAIFVTLSLAAIVYGILQCITHFIYGSYKKLALKLTLEANIVQW